MAKNRVEVNVLAKTYISHLRKGIINCVQLALKHQQRIVSFRQPVSFDWLSCLLMFTCCSLLKLWFILAVFIFEVALNCRLGSYTARILLILSWHWSSGAQATLWQYHQLLDIQAHMLVTHHRSRYYLYNLRNI